MYEDWKVERWETPVSSAKSLAMVSLIDEGCLAIILQDLRDPSRRRFCFTFSNYPVYRNILEEYRTELWERLNDKENTLGWTLTVRDSPWIAAFRQTEPLLEVENPHLIHYMICTEDDVVEVLSSAPPDIREIEPGKQSESVGKSQVYHHPEDREQIEKIVKEVREKQTRE